MTLTLERLRQLPKAELHIHLDGCLRPATMVELAKQAKVELPVSGVEALRKWMLVDDARDLEDYLKRFEVGRLKIEHARRNYRQGSRFPFPVPRAGTAH